MEEELKKIVKKRADGSQDQGKLYEWQTSDSEKGAAPFTFIHLLAAFVLSAGVGAYLMRF